ncbi:MAG TPA: ASCH domain-containing protein [Armatimonadota bacterium]|nr:ASCH domain-containing protein [Armatimonadota bacterium]
MYAINFYSDIYEHMLRTGRKCATIRAGDKSGKYKAGLVVWITVGQRYGKRRKLFCAVIDSVAVKPVQALTPREIGYENPEFRSVDDIINLLSSVYDRLISPEETVTVVRFSPIEE